MRPRLLPHRRVAARPVPGCATFVFSGHAPQSTPVLVLLGAQPAAGKSQAMAALQQRHAGRSLVPLYRGRAARLPPAVRGAAAGAPAAVPQRDRPGLRGVRMSVGYAREHGFGLVIEGVFRVPEMTVSTAEKFAAAGYQVKVVGLGVRAERSRLDSLHRYLVAGRSTPPAAHDGAYQMLPGTIAATEASPAVRRVTLTDRTGADLYVNERTATGAWRREPTGADALHSLRARPLPPDEVATWLTRHRDIAVRGELTATTLPVLRQVAADAHAVTAMDPAP
ncbi:zeta toxin family protein [Streptomyces lavendulocolor]|uniref:zeta toxin family protein n=1 Tax=Streptomyces lavendulocolor TaxID=67316 RepID=UPI003C2F833A